MITAFVPGRLENTHNGAQGSWKRDAGYRKRWRRNVALVVKGAMNEINWNCPPEAPKKVWLTAHVWNLLDIAGLNAALKPVEDGLCPPCVSRRGAKVTQHPGAGAIHTDRPDAGHVIVKGQRIDRKNRGVWITVEPR